MLTVLVAVRDPKYGEEEALKVWTVPEDIMSNGPLVENVCEVPERVFREVMPEPEVAPMQVPLDRQTFPVPLNWIPPANEEVAEPVLAKAVLERISPEASIAPDVVVACPTPKPPLK